MNEQNKNQNLGSYQESIKHNQDELAVQYLPAVKAMAYRMKERLPSSVDTVDLISIGAEELVKLSRRYDDQKNDSFWGFAKQRVHGAMLDYLRSLDVLSRSNRRLVKAIEDAILRYMNEHEKEPDDTWLAQELGEDVKKIREARIAADIYSLMPLNEQLATFNEAGVDSQIEQQELIEIIRDILEGLGEREQLVIQLYYFEELNLKEISQILEITESRISQIHKAVLKKVRDRLGELHG